MEGCGGWGGFSWVGFPEGAGHDQHVASLIGTVPKIIRTMQRNETEHRRGRPGQNPDREGRPTAVPEG